MYVEVCRENGGPLLVNLEPNVRRVSCDNAYVEKAVIDRVPLLDTCACCERRLVVIPHDANPDDYPVIARYLKGGRPH